MNYKKSTLFILLLLIIGVQTALAATGITALEGPFKTLSVMLHNTYIVFGLTLIFFFALLYGIYASALKMIPTFKGENGLSHQGKVVALALSGLSTLSIFYFTKGSPQKLLQTVLDPFGVFGGIVLGALFAGITYLGVKGENPNAGSVAWAFTAMGLGIAMAGYITNSDAMLSWGILIMIIALIIAIASSVSGRAGHDESHGGEHGGDGHGGGHGADNHGGGHGIPSPHQVENFRGRMNP